MVERKLTAFHQRIKDNLDNRKTREEYKQWSSRTGLITLVRSIAGHPYSDIVDRVLAHSEGKVLPHTGKKTLYYPPQILADILREVLKERIAPKERQNIEIYLSKLPT